MDAELVLMAKDGETLEVHPSCVHAHEQVGWHVAPKPEPAAAPTPKAKGKPA